MLREGEDIKGEVITMRKEKMLEVLRGYTIIEGADWFKKNDPEMLEGIMESEYCDFEKKEGIIEVYFGEEGTETYAASNSANCDYPSQNQPPWFEDDYEDWTTRLLKPYLENIEGK